MFLPLLIYNISNSLNINIKPRLNTINQKNPYHPRFNAIKQFFSQMKHYLKLYKSKNFEELKLNLTKSIKNIKKENYENYHKVRWACHL
jgi:transposase